LGVGSDDEAAGGVRHRHSRDEDIRVYVRGRLTTDVKLKKWPPAVQKEIDSVIMEKSSGMYGSSPKHHVWCVGLRIEYFAFESCRCLLEYLSEQTSDYDV
jgi:hypothetical protein